MQALKYVVERNLFEKNVIKDLNKTSFSIDIIFD